MNNQQSPLIPQGSFLEQKMKGRARVKIAVFFVLAIHGIGLIALLMQGCRREEPQAATGTSEQTNNAAPPAFDNTNQPPVDTNVAPATTPNMPAVTPPTLPTPTPELAVPATTTEYKVAKGDSFYTLAKKFHTTLKAIAEANPGVDSSKLKIGQTLHIPAATAAPATGADTATAPNGTQIYTVKSGDTLSKLATQFGTTVKAIRAANNMTTDRITVSQKLKIPVKAAVPAPAATTETAPPTAPAPR
jgi:LysM repeat protein